MSRMSELHADAERCTVAARKMPPRPLSYDPSMIARLCERVYRDRLGDDAARMVAKDKDDGAKLRRRAMAYAPIVRSTLDAMHGEPGA